MSQFLIYVNLPKHLSQFITHHLGEPVVFPPQSNENSVIRAFLHRRPDGLKPELPEEGMTAVAIPDSVSKPPEVFNYVGPKGKAAICEAIKDIFLRALWSEVSTLNNSAVGLNNLIAAWCESHGIDVDQVETVRQCYYRIRKSYDSKGIRIKKIFKKK